MIKKNLPLLLILGLDNFTNFSYIAQLVMSLIELLSSILGY